MVNKRNFPTYFDVIKEPMAFSRIKIKTASREYIGFQDFVRDCALVSKLMGTADIFIIVLMVAQIVHNAQVYNRPESLAYQDAALLKVC